MTTEIDADRLVIREAVEEDFDAIWPFFEEIARAGETYAYARDIKRDAAFRQWMVLPRKTFVVEDGGEILGSYYLKTNHAGPGRHVSNCGYMVAPRAQGRGLARAMCEHSQRLARELGYRAMQFNFVAASNEGAVALWKKLGFAVVGTVPEAFEHPQLGYVDALVMHKSLV
jgi:ribosomal protein S18 acetylase RimI-like enzyme